MSPDSLASQAPRAAKGLYAKLSMAIRGGQFTPFLGAGASSLREPKLKLSAPPWKQVMLTVAELATHLETRESLHFLRAFAAQRLGLTYKELAKFLDDNASTDGSDFYKNGLVELQVELIHSTVRLMEYFGTLFAEETPSVHDLAGSSVPFDPAALEQDEAIRQLKKVEYDTISQEADVAIRQLFKLATIAKNLADGKPERRESPFLHRYPKISRALDIQRLHEKVLTLIVTLLGTQRHRYNDELLSHMVGENLPIPADVDAGENSDFGRLRLDAVQWMSDLLWYTLRYWVPNYPTTADLAYELSLRVPKAPARRAELAQAAQALENEYFSSKDKEKGSLADDMAAVIRYCERYQREMPESVSGISAFYYAIAAALQHQYEMYKEQSLENPDVGTDTVPIVFSTNFDNALERIFEDNDLGYHIIYPTIGDPGNRYVPATGDVAKPVWRIKTCPAESDPRDGSDRDWAGVPDPPTPQHKPGELIGPLVLKIHGAPCLKIAPESGFKHWLVLSEADYLQALATASNMPEWIREQLGEETKSQRYLWFLGYSMSDWNVRLRLFEHCKVGTRGLRGAVDRDADLYRTALLANRNISVEQWIADLSLLPQQILELFVINRLQCSEKVSALIHKLRELLEGRR